MGNCQAIDAAALVIQHPCGRIESEVMRMNPGHYVSLIIPLPPSEDTNQDDKAVRFTRVKLLRPSDTLALGHAYRLVTSQGVMEVLKAKKYAKTTRQHQESSEKLQHEQGNNRSSESYQSQVTKHERRRLRTAPANTAAMSSKSWYPSLQTISEFGS
ncbi:Serine/threonine-protein kinase TAO3 [Gossypium australe]|uniref:Serine/threonine-protein kinase TAO3 n=1 Tax=Gossypium australe TaxID=47621 RepID=A0A5B6WNW1_9ROSI|nr:Serine/threonine-protein kinase TAO3 [Gossypium australe]